MNSTSTASTAGWPAVCVFGAGAVGCYFGARLAMAGAPVTLIARGPHVQAIGQHGLIFESAGTRTPVRLTATTEPDAVTTADLVLFCVKSRDTDSGARTIAARLKPGAVVVSLQNGVDNVARMRAAAGLDALAAVVYVACSMAGPGHVRHAGRGDLVLGGLPDADDTSLTHRVDAQAPARVAAVFERAGVPCPVSADVRVDLWVKLAMNCVFNPISALGRAHYARLVADEPTRAVMRDVIAECVQVAHADGVALPTVDELLQSALALGHAMAQATSSTAQDLAAGRPTEIDSLNGYVARRARELHVAAPVNQALQALVRLAEG
ncbi:MAG: 2-dehydropantoate 2-reductase [Burkholderiaceae bacterium]|nr:2-dehydropantoate 2-reductase [Burkholderiaceae bacterium]